MNSKEKRKSDGVFLSIGMIMGIAVGALFGYIFSNTVVFVGLGLIAGAAAGAAVEYFKKKD